MLLTEQTPVKYVVVINGVQFGTPQVTRSLAEALVLRLSPEQQSLVEIRTVTPSGAELLLG